jgi:hypothetical protein
MSFEMNYAEEMAKKNSLHPKLEKNRQLLEQHAVQQAEASFKPVPSAITPAPAIGSFEPEPLGIRTIAPDFDAVNIPPRNWIIDKYALGGYITLLGAAGATGKSMFTLCLATSVALGRDLLDLGETRQGNVLVINNEDDNDELDRRFAGVFKAHRIRSEEVTNKLYLKSGYGKRITVSNNLGTTTEMISPDVEKIVAEVKRCDIKVLIIDPFVSTHDSNENDNSALDQVMGYYRQIASETGVAIILVHHTRKNGDESDSFAGNVDAMRGASATKDAARLCFTLSKMGKKSATDHGIDEYARHQLIRLDDAKNNFTLADGKTKWLKMEGVQIANGEWIGVPRSYDMPESTLKIKPSAESKEHTIFSYIAKGIIALKGSEGGAVKRPELTQRLYKETNHKSSKISKDLGDLPIGLSKNRRVDVDGRFYRIHQVEGNHSNAARTIHLVVDE